MKNITNVETGIASNDLLISKDILGLLPSPQLRWNVGSFIGQILSGFSIACHVFVTSTKVCVFEALTDFGVDEFATLASFGKVTKFIPAEGTTKVRPITAEGYAFTIATPSSVTGTDAGLASFIAKPSDPSYSAGSLVTKIISFYEDMGAIQPYLIVVDQVTGTVSVLTDGPIEATTVANILGLPIDRPLEIGATKGIYTLSDPSIVSSPETPQPVWG